MILRLINRIVRYRVKSLSFPKLQIKQYNKLWKVSQNKLLNLPFGDCIPIIKNLMFNLGSASLLAIPTIFWIIQKSEILDEKDSKDHSKVLKALDPDNNNIECFFKWSLIFSLTIKFLLLVTWLLWLPLRIAIVFYVLDYLNYDVSYFYFKLNNLSLGILDLYYRTLVDFLEHLFIKYDYYK